MHYGYEHNNGHHRTVATTEDPATALKGETFSQFFWKSFLGSYKSVYGMEKKAGKPIYLNCAVLSVLSALSYLFIVYLVLGFQGFFFAFLIGFMSIRFLETINYMEHYGLLREKK